MNYLLDTNIIIYHLKGQLCTPFPSEGNYFVSVSRYDAAKQRTLK